MKKKGKEPTRGGGGAAGRKVSKEKDPLKVVKKESLSVHSGDRKKKGGSLGIPSILGKKKGGGGKAVDSSKKRIHGKKSEHPLDHLIREKTPRFDPWGGLI